MNRRKMLKSTVLPVAVISAAMTFTPAIGVQHAFANTQQVGQNIVRGTVVDENGETVIGATVMVVGPGSNGTVTDLDGNFNLNVKPGAKLKISFVGYDPVIVVAKNGMKITLKENTNNLQTVEVVA